MRSRFVIGACAAFALMLVATPAYSDPTWCCAYGVTTYSPDEQHGGTYDCPLLDKLWIGNGFAKNAAREGKAIFIDNNGGNWIATDQDSTTYTLLWRPDLESTTKKGSVRNISSFTYDGWGEEWYETTHGCA
jgi:hypothetical protein